MITRYAGDKFVCLSTDTKPLDVSNGATLYESDTKKEYILVSGAWETVNNGGSSLIRGTFIESDISTGLLTITHNLGLTAPYSVGVIIVKNTGEKLNSVDYTCSENTVAVDLSLWQPITGTWGYLVV